MAGADYKIWTGAIRDAVSADTLGRDYGLNPGRDGRCRCIFCDGNREDTLRLYPGNRGFYCFRCHERGDVIKLYQQITGAGFRQAVEGLNDQYGLGLPLKEADPEAERRARERAAQRRKEQQEKEEREKQLLTDLWDASDAVANCDRVIAELAPRDPAEPWRQRFVIALRYRDELADYRDRLFDELYGSFSFFVDRNHKQ